jgi:glucokinase
MYGAVDVGGTKTLVAVFDAGGAILEQHKFPTPPSYDEFLTALNECAQQLEQHEFLAVAVAVPGKIDREEGIGLDFGNLPWHDVTIQADCEKIFHCPILVENDANLAGLSEALLHPEQEKALYITISTGIGTGVISSGAIDPEFADMEGGQMLMEHDGHLVKWESFASGKAIVATYGKRASELDDVQAWKTLSRYFATGMINLFAIVQPDIVIIGGGVGTHFDKFGDFLQAELKKYQNPLVPIPPIVMARRPEEAVVYGCFELARSRYAAVA